MSGMEQEFITSVQLQTYFVDKITGAPLSGGYVEFFKDSNRVEGKDVYQKVQNGFDISGDPLYEYVSLGNVVQLSGVGTFMDANNNDIAVYYYPWDEDGNLELYYIAVFDSSGTPQFPREGWPNTFGTNNPSVDSATGADNQISNPQFVEINFEDGAPVTFNLTGAATTTIPIAPDWDLVVAHSATTTVIVERDSIAGSSNFPTQAPYYLHVTPGGSITSLQLVQEMQHNPGIWSPSVADEGGYLAANMVLGPASPTTKITYTPSSGTEKEILSAANATDDYVEYTATVQLDPSNNAQTSDVGSVSIVVDLGVAATTIISSIQVVALGGNTLDVKYEQETVNRQVDHLFNYYNPLLQFKPIQSHLVGWNFPYNPAQFTTAGALAAQAVGVNKSYYAWDQTIIFQSVDSMIAVSRATSGALTTTFSQTGQMALVQYLEGFEARQLLNLRKSVMVSGGTSVVGGVRTTVSLWYTKDVSLPNIAAGTNNSMVLTLDANGKPATTNPLGTWFEVPRSNLGDASFTLEEQSTTNFNNYGFNGWDLEGDADVNLATFFAIVVGTEEVAATGAITWNSISLVDGDIPTLPGVEDRGATTLRCQQYFQKSFPPAVEPAYLLGAAGATLGAIEYCAQNSAAFPYGVSVVFPQRMRATPTARFWSLLSSNGTWTNLFSGNPVNYFDSGTATVVGPSVSGTSTLSPGGMVVFNPQTATDTGGETMAIHYTLDARLGIV